MSRAWLTIDSDIYVWKYEDGSDLAYFDGLSDTILSVNLVTPKPGILQPHIKVHLFHSFYPIGTSTYLPTYHTISVCRYKLLNGACYFEKLICEE